MMMHGNVLLHKSKTLYLLSSWHNSGLEGLVPNLLPPTVKPYANQGFLSDYRFFMDSWAFSIMDFKIVSLDKFFLSLVGIDT